MLQEEEINDEQIIEQVNNSNVQETQENQENPTLEDKEDEIEEKQGEEKLVNVVCKSAKV